MFVWINYSYDSKQSSKFRIYGETNVKKTCSKTKFEITPLGQEAETMMDEPVGHPSLQRHGPIYIYIYSPGLAQGMSDPDKRESESMLN